MGLPTQQLQYPLPGDSKAGRPWAAYPATAVSPTRRLQGWPAMGCLPSNMAPRLGPLESVPYPATAVSPTRQLRGWPAMGPMAPRLGPESVAHPATIKARPVEPSGRSTSHPSPSACSGAYLATDRPPFCGPRRLDRLIHAAP
jgi:hypothetical protein